MTAWHDIVKLLFLNPTFPSLYKGPETGKGVWEVLIPSGKVHKKFNRFLPQTLAQYHSVVKKNQFLFTRGAGPKSKQRAKVTIEREPSGQPKRDKKNRIQTKMVFEAAPGDLGEMR